MIIKTSADIVKMKPLFSVFLIQVSLATYVLLNVNLGAYANKKKVDSLETDKH